MQITYIEAKTLPEVWYQSIRRLTLENLDKDANLLDEEYVNLKENGVHVYTIDKGSFKGQRRLEFDYVLLHIEYPVSKPIVPDVPIGVPAPCTMEYIENYLPYLMAGVKTENEDYTYGQDLWKQIPEIIRTYKEDGYNQNQAFMAVGSADSLKLKDPQCLRMSAFP